MAPFSHILIEGPDCSGKSTLAHRLKNELRWDLPSLHHREGNQFDRYMREYALSEKVVFERGHFSEEVYSTLWRGGNPFSHKEKEILDTWCELNAIVIFACPLVETLRKRFDERNYFQQVKKEELEKSLNLFCKAFERVPHVKYFSSSQEELETLIVQIKGATL